MSLRFRRFIASCSLASFVLLLVGVPVPPAVHKDAAQAFPCQHHACGCMDADQCWQGCCCFSHEEKLAWAAEHGIAVPALASQPAACDVAGRGDGGDCCSEHDGADHHSVAQTESNDDPAPTPWRLVWGSRVLKCQGGSGVWLVIGPALAPPAPFEVSWEATLVAWLTLQDDHSLEVVAGVGSPPPESA